MHSPRDRLRVAVIGGGIAGLAAARMLREKHDVTVYERNSSADKETGAAVGLGPNGAKMAQLLGITRESVRGVISSGIKTYDREGKLLSEKKPPFAQLFGSDWWFVHRQDLKDVLLELATSDGDPSFRPVNIVNNAIVTRIDPEFGQVTFADGSTIVADLVVAADGIHSATRDAVAGTGHPGPAPVGLSIYRFTLSTDEVLDTLGSFPEPLNHDNGPFLTMLVSTDGSNHNVVIYPCRDGKVLNFGCAVPDSSLKNTAEESWTCDGNIEEMVSHFHDFPAWVGQIMGKLTEVKLYQLRDLDPLPSYVKGRTVLIGDAAHPMTPYQGQGANQALEDAEGLSLLLECGGDRDAVPRILKKWESVRRPRASQVQLNSRFATSKVSPETTFQRMKFNWTYDGISNAVAAMDVGKI